MSNYLRRFDNLEQAVAKINQHDNSSGLHAWFARENNKRPLAWLPNAHGYAFVGLRHDGTAVQCRIERGQDGIHRVVGEEFKNLRAWRLFK